LACSWVEHPQAIRAADRNSNRVAFAEGHGRESKGYIGSKIPFCERPTREGHRSAGIDKYGRAQTRAIERDANRRAVAAP
jgi:hypothetical protein